MANAIDEYLADYTSENENDHFYSPTSEDCKFASQRRLLKSQRIYL
jgi:hypothetical protein